MNQKKRNYPYFNFTENMILLNKPLIIGAIYGMLPLVIGIATLYFAGEFAKSADVFPTSFDQIVLDVKQKQFIENGRVAVQIFIFGIMYSYRGVQILIPFFEKQENEQYIKNIQNQLIKKAKQQDQLLRLQLKNNSNAKNFQYYFKQLEQNYEDQYNIEKLPQISPNYTRNLKQKNYMYTILLMAILFNIILQLKKFDIFIRNMNLFLFFFVILEIFIEMFLSRYMLKEALLVAPIMVSLEYTQQILIPTSNFDTFLNRSLLRLFLVALVRLTFDPVSHYLKLLMFHIYKYLKKKSKENEKYDWIVQILSKKYKQKTKSQLITQKKFDKNKISREQIIRFLFYISTKSCVNIIRVFISVIPFLFPENLEEKISFSEFSKTLIPQLILSVMHNLLDFFVVYLMELIHGYEIYQYLCISRERYKRRKSNWLLKEMNLDKSIKLKYRSIDYLGFSEQYYYSLILLGGGITLVVWSVHICYNLHYVPFTDPSTILYIPLQILIFFILIAFDKYLDSILHIWKTKQKKEQHNLVDIVNMDKYIEEHHDIYRQENIIDCFIENKKQIILNNMEKFINKKNFSEQNYFLLALYYNLENSIKGDYIDHLKQEIILKNKINKFERRNFFQKNQKFIKDKKIKKNLHTMIYYWYYLAKDLNYFKKQIKFSNQKFLKHYCENCGDTNNLKQIKLKSLKEIIRSYRVYIAGKSNNDKTWIQFFEKNQKFKTFCRQCSKIYKIKKFKQNNVGQTKKPEFKSQKLKNHFVFREINNSQDKTSLHKILLFWHLKAKSSILHFNIKDLSIINQQSKNIN